MRGQANRAAPGELPAWRNGDRTGAGGRIASLRAAERRARAIRAERRGRGERAQCAAEEDRWLVRACLEVNAASYCPIPDGIGVAFTMQRRRSAEAILRWRHSCGP